MGWFVLGAAGLVLAAILVAIVAYPRDGSF